MNALPDRVMSRDFQSNITEAEPQELQWYEVPGWRWAFSNILVWLMPAILAFGIVFNLLCLLTIAINKNLFPKIARQNMMITAVCDAIVLSVCGSYYYHRALKLTLQPGSTVLTMIEHMHSSNAACKLLQFLIKYLMNGTPFFHVGLTLERVLAVTMPLKVKQIITVKVNCALLLVLAILGSLAPAIWAAEIFHDGKRCSPLTDAALLRTLDDVQYNVDFYLSKLALFVFLLAGCVIVFVALCRQSRQAAQLTGNIADKTHIRKNIAPCAVMILMNVVFFVSQGPRAAMSVYEGYSNLYGYYSLTEAQIDTIYEILYWITFLHNLIDPFAYLMGGGFCKAFKQLLRQLFGWICFYRPG